MMIKKFIGSLTFTLLLLFSQPGFSQLSEDAYISLLTCRPGDEIFSSWGHTGIRVYDKAHKIDHVFNYGMFTFQEPNFLFKFLRGKLLYWVDIEEWNQFYYQYQKEKRTIIEQKLNLSQENKNLVFTALQNNLKVENRKYLYDFFFDNCSTRPRDIILKQLSVNNDINEKTEVTFRQLLDPYILHQTWTDFGIDLIIGSVADKKSSLSQQMFLPEKLSSNFDNILIGNDPLVSSTELVLDFESEIIHRNKYSIFRPIHLFAILLLLEFILFLKRKKNNQKWVNVYDKIWFGLLGICGLIVGFMWLGTDHIATKNNLNILWLNPIFLALIFINKKQIIWTAVACLILTLIGSVCLQEIHHVSIIIITLLIIKLSRLLLLNPHDSAQMQD